MKDGSKAGAPRLIEAPSEGADDVGVDQAPDRCIAFKKSRLRPLALGQIEHESDTLAAAPFEGRRTDQHGHTRAVLAEVLLFVWLEGSGHLHLGHGTLGAVLPIRWRENPLVYGTRNKILAVISHDMEERVINVNDDRETLLRILAFKLPSEDPDDVGVDQAPDLRFALRQIAVQAGILERDRRLRGEQLQHCDSRRREHAWTQVVLEVQHTDEFGLSEQWQA